MSFAIYEIIFHLHAVLDLFWLVWRFSIASLIWLQWSPRQLIDISWLLFAAYWLASALGSKKASRRESLTERLGHIIFMAVGSVLLYDSAPPYLNWLNHRFIPDERWIDWLGAWLTLAGVLFAIWARTSIGREWSAEIQIKQGHQLIRTGPYARIRHPIYTGILLAVAGTALAIGEYRALFALAILCIAFARKAKKEESFLAAQFGPAFEEHRRSTGFFLPIFRG
jgi:protein-S-isoprenylcysteine O-methyltransferase Ste14